MDSELDSYLTTSDALKQSAHLDETVIRPGDDIDGFTRRRLVVIQGPGHLFVPQIAGADVHLISNVTLVTSSDPTTNSQIRQHFPTPIPVDTNGVSLLLPTFTVAPGSKLIRKP